MADTKLTATHLSDLIEKLINCDQLLSLNLSGNIIREASPFSLQFINNLEKFLKNEISVLNHVDLSNMDLRLKACSRIAEFSNSMESKQLSVIHLCRNGLSPEEMKLVASQFGVPESDFVENETKVLNSSLNETIKNDSKHAHQHKRNS